MSREDTMFARSASLQVHLFMYIVNHQIYKSHKRSMSKQEPETSSYTISGFLILIEDPCSFISFSNSLLDLLHNT
ncbi:hypothetical protein CDL12_12051 [Handroanthus impetiginosus]|uniref:Uncharacterized protein n=1 Tax=Handroanthus impetiginosus TaxID=429701 RepID=A0A2G9HDE2_9LAMI|nr:hypothetical protein CDL12_12051 [Handroanthus impetiginosus]